MLKMDKSALADMLNEEAVAMENDGKVVVNALASSRDEDDMRMRPGTMMSAL